MKHFANVFVFTTRRDVGVEDHTRRCSGGRWSPVKLLLLAACFALLLITWHLMNRDLRVSHIMSSQHVPLILWRTLLPYGYSYSY